MSDERTESPNMLTPEQGRSVEVPHEAAETAAAAVEAAPEAASTIASEAPSNVVEMSQREVAPVPTVEKDPVVKAVDGILEAKLEKFFDALDADQQAKFIAAGEALTAEIVREIHAKKANFSAILDRITKWLHLLPMLSTDYLRQEAWIKTQAIVQFAENEALRNDLAA